MKTFPSLSSRLGDDAAIVADVHFERAILEMQCGSEHSLSLSRSKQRDVRHLLLTNTDKDVDIASRSLSGGFLAADIMKQDEASVTLNRSKYMDLRFLLPTPNICGSLFSSAGLALSDRRKGALPTSIEVQLFLHAYCFFWGLSDVVELMP